MDDFIVLVLPGTQAISAAATLDLLSAAALLAPRHGLPAPRWRVVSPVPGPVRLSSGLVLEALPLPRRLPAGRPTWIVPGIGVTNGRRGRALLAEPPAQAAMQWLRRAEAQGACVAASCSGVLLLAGAGLLAGRRATTAWWLASLLRELAPACSVDEARMVIEDGNLLTAGAALAQVDLMLWLLRRRFGQPLAEALARVMLIDGRQHQSPYIEPAILHAGHALLARIEAEVRARLPQPTSVQALAEALAMTPRTLARQVRAASGRSPLALIQSVRVAHARAMLEGSGLSVEEVAHRVGYGDATALRRLMKRSFGATPRQVRGIAGRDAPRAERALAPTRRGA
ncbi:GlxA family transcriptional regulator [Aquabacterium humicola]|uniref:GlxA family transcriptional regulator n=1 Tax=Aquabacterium humicola TaxID=3237377 RepID=UPI002542F627|nr:helix-turn-helix domain-containing protein [Rubrivivax pictus]